MAKRPASRAVKKARGAAKKNVSTKKPRLVAAKRAKPTTGGASKDTKKKDLSVELKRAKPRAAAPPKSSLSRLGGKPKSTANTVQRAGARAVINAKQKTKLAAAGGATRAKAKAKVSQPRGKARRMPPYLAAELGQPVDHEGEPIGAGSPLVRSDADLQAYALRLWRQMQSGRVVSGYLRAVERAGLTIDEVWTVGIAETGTTSSSPDELRRYHQKLLFRANLLEAILSETVAELQRLPGIEPTPLERAGEPA